MFYRVAFSPSGRVDSPDSKSSRMNVRDFQSLDDWDGDTC